MAAIPQPAIRYGTNPYGLATAIADKQVPIFSQGNIDYVYLGQLGLPQYVINRVILDKYGRQTSFLPALLEGPVSRMKPLPAYVQRRKRGTEIMRSGLVIDTVTGNGTGLDTVELVVSVEGGPTGEFFTVGHEIVSRSRRNFTVIETGINDDGFQTIVVRPNDGINNLVVTGGTSVDFPDNSLFGDLGVTKFKQDINTPGGICVTQDFKNRLSYFEEEITFGLTRKFMEFKRDRETLQNEILNGGAATMHLDDGNGNRIYAFVTRQEEAELIRTFNYVNASMLYSRANNNPDMNVTLYDGLKYQIPSEYRFSYTPSEITVDWIDNVLSSYFLNNPYAPTDGLVWYQGTYLYQQVQRVLREAFKVERRTDPNRSLEEVERPFSGGPDRYQDYVDIFGYRIRFIRMPDLDRVWLTGSKSPVNPNVGITAHDGFIIDPSPIQNLDPSSLTVFAEQDYKLNTYCAQNADGSADHIVDVSQTGMVDQFGNTISSGIVRDFSEITTRHVEISYGLELADRKSAFYMEVA